MRLSLYTDYSLRLLVYLATPGNDQPISTARVAKRFRVSAHHMHKVAQGLRRLGYVKSLSGRHGGLQLAAAPASLRIGAIVEALEGSGQLADCARGPCPLNGGCLLKGALDRAEQGFIEALNQYTVADVVRGPTLVRLERMMRAA